MSTPTAVFLSHTGAPSGAELAFARLAAALQERGLRTHVVLTEAGAIEDVLRATGVESSVITGSFTSAAVTRGSGPRALLTGLRQMIATGWAVGAHLRQLDAAVIVAESTKSLLMAAIAGRRAGIPVVWQVHDRISNEYFGRKAPLLRLLGFLAAAAFLPNSVGTAATLWTGRKPRAVCYPGVDRRAAPAHPPQRDAATARLVMVARLTPWKGHEMVLRALANTQTAATLTVVGGTHFGEDDYAAHLQSLAADLGIESRVRFVGHMGDPTPELTAADVMLHYSTITEPFGQVVVEAMAAGTVVVAAAAGGPAEIITDQVDGILVPPNDIAALTAAIDTVVSAPELRSRLAQRGLQRAADFDITRSAEVAAATLTRVAPTLAATAVTPDVGA